MSNKKPPDKIITVKCPLNLIVKNDEHKPILFDACFRTNQIIIPSYQFLRLWILNKYHNKIEIPEITFDIVKMAFSSLTINDKGGNKPKGENLKLGHQFIKSNKPETRRIITKMFEYI